MKKHTIKIRLISTLLAVMTALSVITVAVIPASASSVSAESIIKDIAKDGFKKIAGKISGGNFFTEILGDTAVSLFDSFIDGDKPSGTSVSEISDKMDAYHQEEIGILNSLSEKIDELHDDINTASFRADYDKMRTDSMRELQALAWLEKAEGNGQTIELNADSVPMITEATYRHYKTVIDDNAISEFTISNDLNAMYLDISGKSQQLKNQNPYDLLIDADARICNASAFSYDQNVIDAANINGSRDTIDGIQADVLIHYAAYINLVKIECLTKIYENPDNAQNILDYYLGEKENGTGGVIPTLYDQLSKIEENYESANTYYDSTAQASVTYHDAQTDTDMTAYYTSIPKAWAYATCTGRQNLSDVTVTLNTDWDVNADTGHMAKQCEWKYSKSPVNFNVTYTLTSDNISFFSSPFDSYGYVPAYYCDHADVGNVTLDLNGHSLTTGNIDFISKSGIITEKNTYSHTALTDSQGTGLVNGYTIDDYNHFKVLLNFLIWEDASKKWN